MSTQSPRTPEPGATDEREPRWYIVHTYSGQEDRVKKNLDLRVQSLDMADRILEVVVPTEPEIVIKDGKRRAQRRKIFPGYILVRMRLDDQSWYVVRNTPGVTGFVSSDDERERRPKPVPLEDSEVAQILSQAETGAPKVSVGFTKGERVRITSGPFADFIGEVNDIDQDKGKVRLLVSFFGRETPVELDFLQVERV